MNGSLQYDLVGIFDDAAIRQKKPRQPSRDVQEVGRLLGMFGRSKLAWSMRALSLEAQQGTMEVTPEAKERIEIACEEIHTIKLTLIFVLGVKPQENRT